MKFSSFDEWFGAFCIEARAYNFMVNYYNKDYYYDYYYADIDPRTALQEEVREFSGYYYDE